MAGITVTNQRVYSGSTQKSDGAFSASSAIVDNRLYALVGRTKMRQTKSLPTTKEESSTNKNQNSKLFGVGDGLKKRSFGKGSTAHKDGSSVSFRDYPDRKRGPRVNATLTALHQPELKSKRSPRAPAAVGHNTSFEAMKEENLKLLQEMQLMMSENKSLREKLSLAGLKSNAPESYKRVYFDRKVLRDAETAYENRIQQLQREANEMTKKYHDVVEENNYLKNTLSGRSITTDKMKDQQRIAEYSKVNRDLQSKLDKAIREREQAVYEKNEAEKQNKMLKGNALRLQTKIDALEKELEYMIMIGYR